MAAHVVRNLTPKEIFVFGSNLSGHHGKGAALSAKFFYKAKQGVGFGFTGNSFAIPTKGKRTTEGKYPILSLVDIRHSVEQFLSSAEASVGQLFKISRIGCGLAGYKDSEIAPLFAGAAACCQFDPLWNGFGLRSWEVPPIGYK